MNIKTLTISTFTLGSALSLALAAHHEDHEKAQKADSAPLIAVLKGTEGHETSGTLHFSPAADGKGVTITIKVSGLQPDATHAVHIHQFGDLSAPDGTSAGGHFNPEGHEHGLPDQEKRHAGDLGNLEANAAGSATKTMTVSNISLSKGQNAILGRSVIIHASSDKGTQPTGDAGPRIAAGVIGYQQVEKAKD
ncbi:MAG: superoxide dismutase family protein [Verrucomicrobiales bacterium]